MLDFMGYLLGVSIATVVLVLPILVIVVYPIGYIFLKRVFEDSDKAIEVMDKFIDVKKGFFCMFGVKLINFPVFAIAMSLGIVAHAALFLHSLLQPSIYNDEIVSLINVTGEYTSMMSLSLFILLLVFFGGIYITRKALKFWDTFNKINRR